MATGGTKTERIDWKAIRLSSVVKDWCVWASRGSPCRVFLYLVSSMLNSEPELRGLDYKAAAAHTPGAMNAPCGVTVQAGAASL